MFSRNTYYKWIHILPTIIVPNCTKNLPWNTHRILNLVSLVVSCTIKSIPETTGFLNQASSTAFFFLENFYLSKSSSALNPPSLPIHSTLRKNAFHPWFRTALLLRLICTYINLKHLGCESDFRSVSFD